MSREAKTHTYEETVSKSSSDHETRTGIITGERSIVPAQTEVETYEKAVNTSEQESVSGKRLKPGA